ncbi:MAG: ABC transporter permease, partial [Candidatus Amulumruptor sp.]|nr:ABC transporter permease [Candidatus Amulumruptor sp.]
MKALRSAIAYGWHQLVSRRIYLVLMTVPLITLFVFYNLMEAGLPLRVPSAVVDLDHSTLSRRVTRNLGAGEYNKIVALPESYHDAMDLLRKGEIMAFFVIPRDFE